MIVKMEHDVYKIMQNVLTNRHVSCQFSSNVFDVSLNAVVGIHVQSQETIHHQPVIIKMSLVTIIIHVTLDLMNGFLSNITFYRKKNTPSRMWILSFCYVK